MSAIEIISASAGSGKTTYLATVLEEAIVSRQARPDAVLATTFTKKAAAELLERARTRLLVAGRVEDAQRLGAARIGTVNAVCGRIVSDFAFELGHSPDMRVLDEQTAAVTLRQALSRVITAPERELLAELKLRFSDFDWPELIERIVTLAHANRIDPASFAPCSARSLAELLPLFGVTEDAAAGPLLDAALEEALEQLVRTVDLERDTTKKTRQALETAYQVLGRLRYGAAVRWKDWLKLANLDVGKASRPAAAPVWQAAAAHDRHPRLHTDVQSALTMIFAIAERALVAYNDYKRAWGAIDFADQEVYALELLGVPEVRAQLAGAIDLVLVDEFQDTSPVQLAIFLRLAEIARRSVWVGDQKQAIFGFRGTDPALMDAAIATIVGTREPTTLSRSRRSRPELVRLTSRLFATAFARHGIPPSRVTLTPEPESEPPGLGPVVERWRWRADNKREDTAALAAAVRDLLDDPTVMVREWQGEGIRAVRAGDVAILCHTNDTCGEVARDLAALGVRAVLPRTKLLATPEAQLMVAGLRLFVDPRDPLAAAQLARLVAFPADGDAWLSDLLARAAVSYPADGEGSRGPNARVAPTASEATAQLTLPFAATASNPPPPASPDSHAALATASNPPPASAATSDRMGGDAERRPRGGRFADLALVERITRARDALPYAGALSAFDAVAEAIEVRERCLEWGDATMRLANLDALRAHAAVYADMCAAEGAGCTPAGLVAALLELAATGLDTQAVLAHEDAVVISTWHSAKGLEWPITVLFDLDFQGRTSALGVQVVSERAELDLEDPLAGRSIRFWPQPYHPQQNKAPFHQRLQTAMVTAETEEREARQALRLLYVGWTRARDRLVLAGRSGRLLAGVLDHLRDDDGPLVQDAAAPTRADVVGEAEQAATRAGAPPVDHGARVDGAAAAETGAATRRLDVEVRWGGEPVVLRLRESAPSAPLSHAIEPGVGYETSGARDYPPAVVIASSAEDGSLDVAALALGPSASAEGTAESTGDEHARTTAVGSEKPVALERIGPRMTILGNPDMARLGEAMHRFLAADRPALPLEARREIASALLTRWEVAASIDIEALLAASDALRGWIDRRWRGAVWHREWPLLHRLPSGTVVRGTSDLVLELPDSYVVIDHKSFPGDQERALERATWFAPQLGAYAGAVVAATAKPVTACFIHLPVSGIVVPVTCR